MKRSAVVVLALAVLLASPMASAKRFGGGFSFGKQSGMVTKRMAPAPTKPAAPTRSATANGAAAGATGAAAAARPGWGGMLGGLAAGLGLAWLASSLGLGEGFGVILLVALGAMLVMVLLRSMRRGMARPAYADARGGASPVAFAPPPAPSSRSGSIIGASLGGSAQPETWGIPEDFDVVGFERAAKQHFVDIQAAWDAADLKAMGELMTDDMLQQIAQQLREREEALGGRPNTTEVLALHARLLGIEEVTNGYVASVEFHGEVREEPGEPATSFREVWNITKARQGGGWLVAGVQALN
jgi:predicted lipid-binding transport protein (Tim44 family)